MDHFRRLMTVVLLTGTIAGLLSAAVQALVVMPLIHQAEAYEQVGHAPGPEAPHEAAAWQPTNGVERTVYTVLGTTLTGIAFAALLFGAAAVMGLELGLWRGVALGLAGFACLALAPALGVPPKPPGVEGAPLEAAQLWWLGTALATAAGLTLVAQRRRGWLWPAAGVLCLALPHLLGAPLAPDTSEVPATLVRQFAVVSVTTQGVFWLLIGGIGGYAYQRAQLPDGASSYVPSYAPGS